VKKSQKQNRNGRAAARNGRAKSPASDASAAGNRPSKPTPAPQQPEKPMPKSHLSAEELEYFQALLIRKRNELCGNVTHMEDEALRRTRAEGSGDLSMMPIHMADIGTDAYEQEFTISLIQNEREVLKEIDAALKRIKDGTYGICEATHKPIAKARLKAKPWARYCVAYKRSQESQGR